MIYVREHFCNWFVSSYSLKPGKGYSLSSFSNLKMIFFLISWGNCSFDLLSYFLRFELPGPVEQDKSGKKVVITCHYCGEIGHKVNMCNKMPGEMKEQQQQQSTPAELGKNFMPYTQNQYRMHPMPDGKPHRFKTLDEITCFKCGENGHFANKCPKGMLAFLSNNSGKW